MAVAVGLTDSKIEGLKPSPGAQQEYPDKLISGLRVRVGASGVKTFILRKRVGSKLKNITLGRYGSRFRLADARKKARDLLVDIEAGKDPTTTLPTPRKNGGIDGTIKALWLQFRDREVRGKKRSAADIERTFERYIIPKIGDRLAESITRGDVTRLVEGVTYANPGRPTPRMGRGVQQQLSAFYTWAMPKLDKLPANPCRDAGRPPPSKARSRYLNEAEIKAFWNACDDLEWPFGPAFKLLLLTGQRRSEVFDADRSEFDGDVWTLPADRAKNGKEHIVPITPMAAQILDALPEFADSDKIFRSRTNAKTSSSGFSKPVKRLKTSMATALKVDEVEYFVLHDLRRTAASHMRRIGISLQAVEAVLNHISGSTSGIVGVYQRYEMGPEKRETNSSWAARAPSKVGRQ
jgi:integrase